MVRPFANADLGARRRRGCLSGVVGIVAILIVGGVLSWAFDLLLIPWGFHMGGRFHWLPQWEGLARMHSNVAGGDYVLYVNLKATTEGSRVVAASNLKGSAWLCTPRHERISLDLNGTMRAKVGTNLNGEKIQLYMYHRARGFMAAQDHKPEIQVYGQWDGPQIVGDDHQSIAKAFLPDGTVYRPEDKRSPAGKELVPMALREGSYWDFQAACRK